MKKNRLKQTLAITLSAAMVATGGNWAPLAAYAQTPDIAASELTSGPSATLLQAVKMTKAAETKKTTAQLQEELDAAEISIDGVKGDQVRLPAEDDEDAAEIDFTSSLAMVIKVDDLYYTVANKSGSGTATADDPDGSKDDPIAGVFQYEITSKDGSGTSAGKQAGKVTVEITGIIGQAYEGTKRTYTFEIIEDGKYVNNSIALADTYVLEASTGKGITDALDTTNDVNLGYAVTTAITATWYKGYDENWDGTGTVPAGLTKIDFGTSGITSQGEYTLVLHVDKDEENMYREATQTYKAVIYQELDDTDGSGNTTVTLDADSYAYTGSEIKPAVTVKFTDSSTKKTTILKEGTDYKVTYSDNKNAAKSDASTNAPTVTIEGIGTYRNATDSTSDKTKEITKTFTITPADLPQSAIDAIKVKTNDGEYDATKMSSSAELEAFTVDAASLPTGVTEDGLTYDVRTYDETKGTWSEWKKSEKTVSDESGGFKTVGAIPTLTEAGKMEVRINIPEAGNYNAAEKIVSLEVTPKDISGTDKKTGNPLYEITTGLASGESAETNGDGKEVTLDSLSVTGLSEDDYTVSYKNNTEPGTATVIVTGKGNYTGSIEKEFEIGYTENTITDLLEVEQTTNTTDTVSSGYYSGDVQISVDKWKIPTDSTVQIRNAEDKNAKYGDKITVSAPTTDQEKKVTVQIETTAKDGTKTYTQQTVTINFDVASPTITVIDPVAEKLGATKADVTFTGSENGDIKYIFIPADKDPTTDKEIAGEPEDAPTTVKAFEKLYDKISGATTTTMIADEVESSDMKAQKDKDGNVTAYTGTASLDGSTTGQILTKGTTYYVYAVETDLAGRTSEIKKTSFQTKAVDASALTVGGTAAVTATYNGSSLPTDFKAKELSVTETDDGGNSINVPGTWSVKADTEDSSGKAIVYTVGTSQTVTAVFTPDDPTYPSITKDVKPTIAQATPTLTVAKSTVTCASDKTLDDITAAITDAVTVTPEEQADAAKQLEYTIQYQDGEEYAALKALPKNADGTFKEGSYTVRVYTKESTNLKAVEAKDAATLTLVIGAETSSTAKLVTDVTVGGDITITAGSDISWKEKLVFKSGDDTITDTTGITLTDVKVTDADGKDVDVKTLAAQTDAYNLKVSFIVKQEGAEDKAFTVDAKVVVNAATTPGTDGSNSGSNTTPGGSNTTPGGSNTTPGGDNTTPGGDNTTPGGDNTTPGGDNTTPGGDNTTPGGDSNTPSDTTVVTNPDGTSTETTKVPVEGSEATATVVVNKDATGAVTGAEASVATTTAEKAINGAVIEAIKAAAGTDDVLVTVTVTKEDGSVASTINVNASDVTPGNKLQIVKNVNGSLVLVNAKNYTVSDDGSVSISRTDGGTYSMLNSSDMAKVTKQIKKTIQVKKASASVKKNKTTKIALKNSLNMANVKKITYTTSKKSVAKVSKTGKITAKKAGKAVVKAKVTLKNGKTKTVKMTVKVKK
jgi:hypothetical protein